MAGFIIGLFIGAAMAIMILGWCIAVEEEREDDRARHRQSYPTDVQGWMSPDEEENN